MPVFDGLGCKMVVRAGLTPTNAVVPPTDSYLCLPHDTENGRSDWIRTSKVMMTLGSRPRGLPSYPPTLRCPRFQGLAPL